MADVEHAITVIEGAAAALESASTTGTAAEITGAQCDLSRAYADHVPTLIAAWRQERAENKRLRAALQPFGDAVRIGNAKAMKSYGDRAIPISLWVGLTPLLAITLGDFRRARAALEERADG